MSSKVPTQPDCAPRLIILAGLHGSGKSTFIRKYYPTGFVVFDDLMKNSHGGQPEFRHSQHLNSLVCALEEGKNIVVADVRFCEPGFQQDFLDTLAPWSGKHQILWRCFKTDKARCQVNLLYRARQNGHNNTTLEFANNEHFCRVAAFPPEAEIVPVCRADYGPFFPVTHRFVPKVQATLRRIVSIASR